MAELDKIFRFRKFKVYQDAREFNRELKSFAARAFPPAEKYALLSQLRRALDSVILNIAEGSERGTDRDFAHFLSMSRASLNEVVASLDAALDQDYLNVTDHCLFLERAADLANQITAFRKKLLESGVKSQRSNVRSS